MNKPEDLLQEQLEKLEAGAALEACLAGAPAEVAAGLRLAARLSSLEWPPPNPGQVLAQRAQALQARPISVPDTEEDPMSTMEKPVKDNRWKGRYYLPVLFASAVAVVICVAVIAAGARLFSPRGPLPQGDQWAGRGAQPVVAAPEPVESRLLEAHGLVQTRTAGEPFVLLQAGSLLEAGMHLRTGALSSATLAFADGSQVVLGPQAELVIDQLQAGQVGRARVITLTQLAGKSDHNVARSVHPGSHYTVQTANAASEARGTRFSVALDASQGTLVQVSSGTVAVSALAETVLVESGQATLVGLDEPPAQPVYFFTGQGTVSFMGESWVIAGQALTPHPGTVVIGSPQVGDQVFFEGRLLAGNTRLVDLIVLVRHSPANRFSLTGYVEAMAADFWTINGQEVAVTGITLVDPDIAVGDLVEAEGLVMADGTLQAETVRRLADAPGLPFDFTGVVQEMGPAAWVISDQTVAITATTHISPSIAAGDLVRVTGWILEDHVWLADRIQHTVDPNRAFQFTGEIQSMNPWQVANVAFVTETWTVVDPGLVVGDQVRVSGQILADGTWVASEIRRLADLTEVRIILVGIVTSTDPWVVSGVGLPVDEETLIAPEVVLGTLVRVEIHVQADGSWKVVRIDLLGELLLPDGCQEVTAVVVSFSGGLLQLQGWPALPVGDEVQVVGELQPYSVVLVQVCYDEDGSPVVVYIYIILTPVVIEPPSIELPGEKVEICHKPNSKNPHTIIVSQSAVPAHLGHGDTLGPCP